jgi:hypothetical protein
MKSVLRFLRRKKKARYIYYSEIFKNYKKFNFNRKLRFKLIYNLFKKFNFDKRLGFFLKVNAKARVLFII